MVIAKMRFLRHRRLNRLAAIGGAITASAILVDLYWPPFGFFTFLIFAVFVPPLAALALAYIFIIFWSPRKKRPNSLAPAPALTTAVVLFFIIAGFLLCRFDISKKLMFSALRNDFRAFETTPVKAPPPGTRLGPWIVVEAEVDPRGGLYIVTGEGADLIDTLSEGLAYKPNRQGSPYGRAEYSLTRLSGNWYWFHANNDW